MFDELHYWYHGAKQKPAEWNGHKHLSDWLEHQRDQISKRRRELYRLFALGLKKYGTVRLEKDFDLSEVSRKAPVENDNEYDKAARYQRKVAAVSVLRGCIANVCGREGLTLDPVAAVNITQECHACGSLEAFDAALSIVHRCESCGVMWDQDYNAARNLWNRGGASSANSPVMPVSPDLVANQNQLVSVGK